MSIWAVFGTLWAVFGPLWACFSADCLEIWHKHTYGRNAPNYAKKNFVTQWRHNVMTSWMSIWAVFGPLWAVFGPLWACFSADCLEIWHKHTYGRDAPIYAKKSSRRNNVMTLWRHKCHFGWFLGHCGRVFRPIAMKFCTHIAMIGAHRCIWV